MKEEQMNYRVLLFYKYIRFDSPEKFRERHIKFCLENDIKGRVFISTEGINATVSGTIDNIERYKNELRGYSEFRDIWFKEDPVNEHAFRKTHVRIKREIVHSGLEGVSLSNGGKRLRPEELRRFYEDNDDFVIVDARNAYESAIGKFKNAITPELETFRDWTKMSLELQDYKYNPVVTYCTGGIRCEKASAYLVEQGFTNVYQLDGGIVTYAKQFPDTYWEGSVFVFDERRIIEPNTKEELKHVGECYYCGKPASWYINCHNQNCDKLLVTCHDCKVENEYCCSDECRASDNKRKRIHG